MAKKSTVPFDFAGVPFRSLLRKSKKRFIGKPRVNKSKKAKAKKLS